MGDIETMFNDQNCKANGATANPTRFTGGLLNQITNVTIGASLVQVQTLSLKKSSIGC